MPAPERVAQWVSQNYPRPSVDPAWLSDCCDWISKEYNISPSTHFDDFVAHVEAQLLQSNLEDSMVPGTGLNPQLIRTEDPPRSGNRRPTSKAKSRTPRRKVDTGPVPLLVEIRTITEIAHSAFNLLNTHQTRLDREDLGLARGNDEQEGPRHQDEDEGPIPNFPRGMLRLELSDGQSLLRAIEYRSIPDLVLGETPLGYKMLLTSTPIRNGIAFLEPSNVTLKGYRTEDHDVHREEVFLRGLRRRLGRPDPEPQDEVQRQAQPQQPQPAPSLPPVAPQSRVSRPPRRQPTHAPPPPVDLDDMYVDDEIDPDILKALEQMETKAVVPASKPPTETRSTNALRNHAIPDSGLGSNNPRGPSAPTQNRTSHYFPTAGKARSTSIPDIGLSPVRAQASHQDEDIDIPWDDDEFEAFMEHNDNSGVGAPPEAKTASQPKPHSTVRTTSKVTAKSHAPTRDKGLTVGSSFDQCDSFSMDMEIDDSFLADLEKAEQQALLHRDDKGKGKNTERVLLSPLPGTKIGTMVDDESGSRSASSITSENTRLPGPSMGARTRSTGDTGGSSARKQAEPRPLPSTQPPRTLTRLEASPMKPPPLSQIKATKRRLTRDPTVIVISSSESDSGDAEREAREARSGVASIGGDSDVDNIEVIDVSD